MFVTVSLHHENIDNFQMLTYLPAYLRYYDFL